jgi:hypothetical protein
MIAGINLSISIMFDTGLLALDVLSSLASAPCKCKCIVCDAIVIYLRLPLVCWPRAPSPFVPHAKRLSFAWPLHIWHCVLLAGAGDARAQATQHTSARPLPHKRKWRRRRQTASSPRRRRSGKRRAKSERAVRGKGLFVGPPESA